MRKRRTRMPAEKQPEVYIMGEILGGEGFGTGVSLVWQMQSESNWTYVDGQEQGQVICFPRRAIGLCSFDLLNYSR